MNTTTRYTILVIIFIAITAVLAFKHYEGGAEPEAAPVAAPLVEGETVVAEDTPSEAPSLVSADVPTLLELGSSTCIPCKEMKKVLGSLEEEYAGRLDIRIVDIFEQPEMAERYNVRVIPTQVFLGPDGAELFRHEGYFPREDIVAQWRQLGFGLERGDE